MSFSFLEVGNKAAVGSSAVGRVGVAARIPSVAVRMQAVAAPPVAVRKQAVAVPSVVEESRSVDGMAVVWFVSS